MGAFISYLHQAHGSDNFFVLAPSLTIDNKLIPDFTAYSTPFSHLFHQHQAGDSTGIRPPVPRSFGRGGRSKATQVWHGDVAGVFGINVRAWRLRIDSPLRVIRSALWTRRIEDRDMEDVVLLQAPELVGDDLSYQVRVLEGTLPAAAGAASLFIDIIGMPLTPVSFAGVRRRTCRRAVIY
ncbi:hypothetical protein [Thiocapsa imhoffii]|uniref:hypothetical protein n=1 Tax=Thiocapsa imhoffii TaxID=382777 RepID=UPI001F5B27F4|nr:hypothetical protein [Thiocapsa imhoffii]